MASPAPSSAAPRARRAALATLVALAAAVGAGDLATTGGADAGGGVVVGGATTTGATTTGPPTAGTGVAGTPDAGESTPAASTGRTVRRLTVERWTQRSALLGRRFTQTAVLPKGSTAGRPLLVFLRGRGMDPGRIAGPAFQRGLDRLGARAPVVVLPRDDGGSYWHDRRSGRWGLYVLREVIAEAVARYGVDGDRVAIGGISMGGFGAFSLARRSPRRFCAVGGHSAALWTSPGAAAPGAFDDAEDFRRNDPLRAVRAGRVRWRVPLWLDAGTGDPFRAAQQAFRDALVRRRMRVRAHRWRGGHEPGYWNRHAAAYLRFYADALDACPPAARR